MTNRRRKLSVARFTILIPGLAVSQTQPAAQSPAQAPVQQGAALLQYYGSLFAGPIAGLAGATRGGGLVGASLGGVVAFHSARAITFPGFDMEVAAVSPVQPGQKLDGIFSFNLQPAYLFKSTRAIPYGTAGYSRVFVSGNALNFGVGVNLLPRSDSESMHFVRIELRDYYTFASERQHLVGVRVAFCFGIPDV